MNTLTPTSTVKVVGSNGQISLGKQFAGRQVLVEEREPGVWMVRTATVVPDNERWIHGLQAASDLKEALDWAASQPASGENTAQVLKRLGDGVK
ncbi:MAG: hypothetical protein WCO72_08670 [Betaproteobacteria bacterium]|jgi:hypothetical protein|nr:hypothetical protein [Betaproteobacteria bacterium]